MTVSERVNFHTAGYSLLIVAVFSSVVSSVASSSCHVQSRTKLTNTSTANKVDSFVVYYLQQSYQIMPVSFLSTVFLQGSNVV